MAFKRTLTKNVTNTPTVVYTFTGPASDTLIGMRVTNTTAAPIKVSAAVKNSGIDYYLIGGVTVGTMGADVPAGASIIIINGDIDKVVLETGDTVVVTSSVATSADVIISALTQ